MKNEETEEQTTKSSSRNGSPGLCHCEKDEWMSVQKGIWAALMSPYEDMCIDVKFVGNIPGSVAVSLEEGIEGIAEYSRRLRSCFALCKFDHSTGKDGEIAATDGHGHKRRCLCNAAEKRKGFSEDWVERCLVLCRRSIACWRVERRTGEDTGVVVAFGA
ncbi:hypothetical protein Nepgr_033141 [Nepenthes gracilis]|uniref:Uncharacterized protein n=1 Tax=Nepenthes gracilis TaxID=150966 RepID=A0AAD3TLS0_NEPGR|nr:hypothetical protein Nepgr_033141 [Nepenthes gracilis]